MGYVRPVNPTGMSSWLAHTQRRPPSQEAGTDYYCDIGTPIVAAADGRVVAVGGSIHDATGRYLTIDLNDGRRVRYLHLQRWIKTAGDPVKQGAVVAYSGASGYGSEFFGARGMGDFPWASTGGPHVHTTLWPTHAYQFGSNPTRTLDFEAYVNSAAGGGGNAFEEDDMTKEQYDNLNKQLNWIVNGLGVGGTEGEFIPAEADTIRARIVNLDQQVTGADDFDRNVGPSIASRLLTIDTQLADILQGTGTNGSVAVDVQSADSVLGIVRELRTMLKAVTPPKTLTRQP